MRWNLFDIGVSSDRVRVIIENEYVIVVIFFCFSNDIEVDMVFDEGINISFD